MQLDIDRCFPALFAWNTVQHLGYVVDGKRYIAAVSGANILAFALAD